VFGGSFDPVHYGHLLLVESCREQCELDEVWLLPAGVPPHKQQRTLTANRHRTAMLELAIAGHPALRVCTLEIERGGVSFTVDTLGELARRYPDTRLFLLMGADMLEDLPHWREPQRVCELAVPVAVGRPGFPDPQLETLAPVASAERLREIDRARVEMPYVGFSSTEIRGRVAAGRSIRYQTPRAVEKYIETHRLYQQDG
jgi:nicotinate-nucleotide adenylyltransferase